MNTRLSTVLAVVRNNGIAIATLLMTAATMPLAADAAEQLAKGDSVRVQSDKLGDGWNDGTLVDANGCLAVAIKAPTTSGATQLLLGAVDRLQYREGEEWREIDITGLRERETASCRAAADKEIKDSDRKSVH